MSQADDLLAQLNPRQREAACHGRGPLLIIAGAGTGKTTTLAHRVAHLPFGNALPKGDDASGQFQSRQIGCAGRHRVVSAPLENIGTVHSGRFDADQDFACLGLRHRPFAQLQHLGLAVLGYFDRAHVRRQVG